jgi:hypothetical protein
MGAGCFHNARVDGAADEAEREPRGLADGPRGSPRQMVGPTGSRLECRESSGPNQAGLQCRWDNAGKLAECGPVQQPAWDGTGECVCSSACQPSRKRLLSLCGPSRDLLTANQVEKSNK